MTGDEQSGDNRILMGMVLLFAYLAASGSAWMYNFKTFPMGWDFREGCYAGAWLLRHQGLDLYSLKDLSKSLEFLEIIPFFPIRHLAHLPAFFLIFVPFTFVSPNTANLIWFVLLQAFVAMTIFILAKDFRWTRERFFWFVLLVLLWRPALHQS